MTTPAPTARSAANRALTLAAALLLLPATAGCGDPTGLEGGVAVHADAERIVARNASGATIYWAAFDRDILPLLLWTPCTDPGACDGVPDGGEVVIRWDDLWYRAQFDAPDDAVFYWWHLVPDGAGGFEPDSIRARVVDRPYLRPTSSSARSSG